MPTYEFEVVNLKCECDERGHRHFRWHCRGESERCDQSGLESLLNRLGRNGWSVVAFDTDSRFGSNLVLQRQIEDPIDAATPPVLAESVKAPKAPKTFSLPKGSAAAAQMGAIADEVRAMREALLHQPQPIIASDPSLISAIQGMTEELKGIAERPERPEPPAPPLPITPVATLSPEVLARLDALADRPAPAFPTTVQAVLDPKALQSLEETVLLALEESARKPQVAALDPASLQWVEELIARATERKDDDSPGAPPVAIIDEGCIARLEASMERAARRQEAMQAVLDPEVVEALRNATATATVDPAVLHRLEETIQASIERLARIPGTAFLAEGTREQIAHAFRAAVADLPVPQVQAALNPASLSELKSALSEAIATLPAPSPQAITASVDPEALQRIEALLGRALQQAAPPTTVTLSPASLKHLEEAICRAVAEATAPKALPEVAEVLPDTKRRFQWWPKMSGRLKVAFR